jgi:hypothetical protein
MKFLASDAKKFMRNGSLYIGIDIVDQSAYSSAAGLTPDT